MSVIYIPLHYHHFKQASLWDKSFGFFFCSEQRWNVQASSVEYNPPGISSVSWGSPVTSINWVPIKSLRTRVLSLLSWSQGTESTGKEEKTPCWCRFSRAWQVVNVMCKQGKRKAWRKGMEMKKDESDLRGVEGVVRGGFMHFCVWCSTATDLYQAQTSSSS